MEVDWVLMGIDQWAHTRAVMWALHWLPITFQVQFKMLAFMCKFFIVPSTRLSAGPHLPIRVGPTMLSMPEEAGDCPTEALIFSDRTSPLNYFQLEINLPPTMFSFQKKLNNFLEGFGGCLGFMHLKLFKLYYIFIPWQHTNQIDGR